MRVRVLGRMVAALVGVGLGLATLAAGGSVLLDLGGARAAEGQYVPFVVWFNFLSGFVYLAAGVGLALGRAWAARLALLLVIGIALAYAAFGLHVAFGGAYEKKTAAAMAFRLALWLGLWQVAARLGPTAPAQPDRTGSSPAA